ncbi:MAG: O-methyltransferase [Lachnospiraceae bacterium]|nr:O-methyltransferase [Lachnospiraceae bacterium]
MIVNERITAYINSLDTGNSPLVNSIRREALDDNVPIIRQESESLLKVMLRLKKPKHILEVGTAVGYSALLMSENVSEDCHITTLEKYEKRIPIAKENFLKAGKTEQITLLEGDATDILKELEGPYDFIFMDAAKGQYMAFFEDAMRLLAPGGILISDNVLQDGDVIESRFAVTRRNRTIHSRMREYLYTLTHHDELTTTILPIGDGMAVSVRRI